MAQIDYISDIAKYGLDNDKENLLKSLDGLIAHYKNTRKINLALRLQSVVKDSNRQEGRLTRFGTNHFINQRNEQELNDLVIDKFTSDYRLSDLIVNEHLREELVLFIRENKAIDLLQKHNLPVSNKLLLHGPSGCGKTLASYVIAGELEKPMYVVNLGAIVSSKLGETSKNLTKLFKKAGQEEAIIFIDEFDSLGKIRDYSQDHGEMKRVVNTILQLFDYLPQSSIVIAATNQEAMLDDALKRRFDVNLGFNMPDAEQIEELILLTLSKGKFNIPSHYQLQEIIEMSKGLSFYSIQKTLINAIKRSLFESMDSKQISYDINLNEWKKLIDLEKKALNKV